MSAESSSLGSSQGWKWLFLLLAIAFYPSAFAEETGLPLRVPEGIDLWAPPEPINHEPVLFIEQNENGQDVRLKLTRTPEGQLVAGKVPISPDVMEELERDYHVLRESTSATVIDDLLARGAVEASTAARTCPLPISLSIVGDSNGEAIGGIDFHDTDRPAGTQTQWIVFDFWTKKYRGSRSHMPIVLRHEDLLHGWGAFIGDNRGSAQGCGSDSRFNSQIEGWTVFTPDPVLYPNYDPDDPSTYPPQGPMFQSQTYKASCGAELVDEPVWLNPYAGLPRYRMLIHANSAHWVAYQIQEYNLSSGWNILTPWTDLDTDLPDPVTNDDWYAPPPLYNDAAEGVFIGATDSGAGVANWEIRISNLHCGWF